MFTKFPISLFRLWPNHSSSHNNLGTLLDDLNEAENHFRQAIAINPCHAKAYYNLATIYRYTYFLLKKKNMI